MRMKTNYFFNKSVYIIAFLLFIVNSSFACNYRIILHDSYGDGWNGGKITVKVNGTIVINELTIPNGYGPLDSSFAVSTGDIISTIYTGGSYSSENGYEIKDGSGIVVASDGYPSGTPAGISSLVAACPVPNDAAMMDILVPIAAGFGDVKAVIRNNGTSTLTSATINWSVDGFSQTAYNYTGSLVQTNSDTVIIGSYNFIVGSHTIVAVSSNPNGSVDGNPLNDTVSRMPSFYAPIATFPYFEDFTSSNQNWYLRFEENSNALYSATGGNPDDAILQTGKTSGSWNYYASVEQAFANTTHVSSSTATIDATSLTSIRFKFDKRQSYTYNTTYNWMRVMINDSIYAKDLNGDSTWNPTTANADPFQTLSFDLTAYAGTSFTISIQLAAKYNADSYGSYGDDLHIDNIKVYQPVPNDLALSSLYSPTPGFEMSSAMDIKVVVYNNGTASQSSYDISYSIDGGNSFVSQNINSSILPDSYDTLVFNTPADLSTVGSKNLILSVHNTGDANSQNDTMIATTENFALPYNDGFESYLNNAIPTHWSEMNTTGYSAAYAKVVDNQGYNSQNCFKLYNSYATSGSLTASLIPDYDGLSDKMIKCWVKGTASAKLYVGVMIDPINPNTFTSIDTIVCDGTYHHYLIDFSAYQGVGSFVTFKHALNSSSKSIYIDDVEFYKPLDNDMQMLSWLSSQSSIDYPSGGVTVMLYNNGKLAQSNIPVAFTTDGGNTIIHDTIPSTILPNDSFIFSFYDLATFASGENICAAMVQNGDLFPQNDTAFYKMMNYSMPFFDDMENYSDDQLVDGIPSGYERLNTLPNSYAYAKIYQSDYNAHSGSYSMKLYNSGSTTGDLLFTIPYYGGTALTDKWLHFWHKGYSTEELIVGVMNSIDNISSFVAIDTIRPIDSYYHKYALLLSSYAGSGKYIAFKHGLKGTYNSLYVDDIHFEVAPTNSILYISEDSLFYRGTRVGMDTTIYKFFIENQGVGQIVVNQPVLDGADAANFVLLDTNTYPKSIGMWERMEIPVGLSGSQIGDKEAFVRFTADGVSDTVHLSGEIIDSVIQTFPFVEDFNSGMLDMGWNVFVQTGEGNGEYEWQFGQGPTPSLNTGPAHDLSGNGYYMFVDAQQGFSSSYGDDETMLTTNPIDFSSLNEPRLNFWYHMYGADVHVLNVFVHQNGNYSMVKSLVGEQQNSSNDSWMMSSVDLSAFSGIIDGIIFQTTYDGPLGDIAIDYIALGENPEIDLGNDTTVCGTAAISLDAGTGNSAWDYQWREINSPTIISTNQILTVASSGTYIVKVRDEGFFEGTDTIIVQYQPFPLINTMSDITICEGDSTLLNVGGSSYSYLWNTGEVSSAIWVNPNQQTSYSVIVSNSYCEVFDTVQVDVNPLPAIGFSGLNTYYCETDANDTLIATPANGVFSGAGMSGIYFDPVVAGVGTHIISYSYTDANQCTSVVEDTTLVKANPTLIVSNDTSICYGASLVLSASNASPTSSDTYLWSTTATTSSITVSPTFSIDYTVILDNGSCQSKDTVSVIVNSLPSLILSADTAICMGSSLSLSASNANPTSNDTYLWNTGATSSSITVSPTSTVDYSVILDNGNCQTSDTVSVIVHSLPNLVLSSDTIICFGESVSLTASNAVPTSSDSYLWSTGAVTNSITVSPSVLTNYFVTLDDGNCQSSDTVTVDVNPLPTVSFSGLAAVYSLNDPKAILYGTPANGSFSGDGISGNDFYPNIAGAGVHTISYSYTDNNQCTAVANQNTEVLSSPVFIASPTSFTAPPFNVIITNNSSSSYNSWYWNFGDGTISDQKNPSHTYLYNGTYTITLLAMDTVNLKVDTVSQTIVCSGGSPNPCSFTSELTQAQTFALICSSDSIRLSATPYASMNYAWTHNGALIPDANDSIYYAKLPGFYMAVLTDNTCSKVTSNYFVMANYPDIAPVISTIGNIAPCSNDSLKLQASSGFGAYLWNTGSSDSYIYVKNSGYYSVSGINGYACRASSPETVINVSLAQIPKICVVGSIGNSNHNLVQWVPENSLVVDSFRVYRETSITNKFDYLGSVSYSDPSEFEDMQSSSAVRQYRYKITAIDTCGKESPTSSPHKTMHLQVNAAINGHWNLIWQAYEGFSFPSYNIYRGMDSLNMTLLTTVASNVHAFTDLNNPAGDIYYQIEVVSTNPCQSKSYGTSLSNFFNTKYASGVGIDLVGRNGVSVAIYPNPNKGEFVLEINAKSNDMHQYQLEIYSSIGQLVLQESLEFNLHLQKQISLETLSKGVYFVRLLNKSEVLTSRFIVE